MFRFPGFNPGQGYRAQPPGLAGQFGGGWHPQSTMPARGLTQGNSPQAAQAQSYGQGMIGSSAPQQAQASLYGSAGGSYGQSNQQSMMSANGQLPQQGMISSNAPQTANAAMMAMQGPQNGQAMQAAQGQAYGAAPATSPGQPAQGGGWIPQAQMPQQGMVGGNAQQAANAMGGLAAQIGARR